MLKINFFINITSPDDQQNTNEANSVELYEKAKHITPHITGKINLLSEAAQLYFVRVHVIVMPYIALSFDFRISFRFSTKSIKLSK